MKLILLAAALLACGRNRGGGDLPGLGVRLVDPGGQPRQTLRYRFDPGARGVIRISLMSSDTVVKQGGRPITFPANVLSFDLEVSTEVPPAKPPQIALELIGVDSTDQSSRDKLLGDVQPLLGGRFVVAIDTRGVAGAIVWEGASVTGKTELLRDDLKSKLPLVFVPLPAEPIGPGARWEQVLAYVTKAGEVHETYRYRLERQGGGALELSLEADASATGAIAATSRMHGDLRAAAPTWGPALATLFRTGHMSLTDRGRSGTIDQIGTLEITAAGEPAIPLRATCAELELLGREPTDECR